MDSFDLKKYLAEGRLFEEDLVFETISDDEIKKAAATALKVSVDDIPDQEPTGEDKIDEIAVSTAITIAGLIPPALNLVGNLMNKTKQLVGLSEQEKKELDELNKKIKFTQELIKKADKSTFGKINADERQARKRLERLEHEKDEKFGTKLGNMAKHLGHKIHHMYTSPIRKFLQFSGWLLKKRGKKTRLLDKEYREKVANIIYAGIMLGVAGYFSISHLQHLTGVGPVIMTMADGIKAGKSISDVIEGTLSLI